MINLKKSTMLCFITMLLFLGFIKTSTAQDFDYHRADSLLEALNADPLNLSTLDSLYRLSNKLISFAPERFQPYGEAMYAAGLAMKNPRVSKNTLNMLAVSYLNRQLYPKALELEQQSLKIAEELNDTVYIALISNNIGSIHHKQTNRNIAIKYYKRAIHFLSNYSKVDSTDDDSFALYHGNLGGIYTDLRQDSLALYHYKQSLSYTFDTTSHDIPYHNMAVAHFNKKDFDSTIYYLNKSIACSKAKGDSIFLASSYQLMGDTYIWLKEFDIAEQYLMQSLALRKTPSPKLYLVFFELYKDSGQFEKAAESYEKYVSLRDDIFSNQKKIMILQMEDSLQHDKKSMVRKKLEHAVSKLTLNTYVLIAIIIVFAVGVAITGRWWFSKYRSKEKQLQDTLDELSEANKKLSTTTFHLLEKEGKISEVTDTLKGISQNGPTGLKPEIKELVKTLEIDSKNKGIKTQFRMLFEDANNNFFEKLLKEYEDLTPLELKISALLRLNLSTKEIATLLNSSEVAVTKGRHRLRKKLKLERATNLTRFLMTF